MSTTELDASDRGDSDAAIDFVCSEEALQPGSTGQAISVLGFERVGHVAASPGAEGDEEDVLLPELTGNLPWPRK